MMVAEKRLIDANDLHAFLEVVRQDYLEENTFSSDFAAEVIETVQDEYLAKAPTVDAVEVVRCRDCGSSEPCKLPKGRVWCRKMCRYMKEDGFCSEPQSIYGTGGNIE